jgi:large repetitive protein
VTLVGTQTINIAPTSNLVSGSQYQVYVSPNSAVTNTDGVAVQPYAYNFTAGTATDTAAPTIATITPPDTSTNIGTNAGVSVKFNKAINPVSVTGSSIQLSGGSVTEVPSSISFTPDYTRTMIIPQAPLPSSTQMAIAISGVTSQAGVAVASKTTHFTTMVGADFSAPYVVNPSVQSSQVVGTNAAFAMQFNKPMDPGSANPGGVTTDVFLYDYTLGYVATTISFSADLTTVFLKPTANLTASHQFELCSYYMTDLSGNPQQNFCVSGFFTGTGTDTTGPVVQQVSPPSGSTGVGINAPVDILFNEAIDGASLAGVTLKQGSTVIATTTTLYDGDQGIQLQPLVPLATGTVYTINVTGVLDITGNTQSSFASQSFTTGTGTDLVAPTIVSTNPTSGQTNVPDNTTCQIVFSEAMDPAVFDPNNSLTLRDASNNVIPATITFSADYKTATLQPTSNLTGGGATYYFEIGYQAYLYDLGGNRLSGTYITFTTH